MPTIEELYGQNLGRASDASGYDFWSDAWVGPNATAAERAAYQVSPEQAAQFQTAADRNSAAAVQGLYSSILGRTGETAGVDFWSNAFGDQISPEEQAQFQTAADREIASRTTATSAPQVDAKVEKTLPSWLFPAVNPLVSKTADLLNNEYIPYTGAQVAGESALQSQAWQGLAGLSVPTDMLNDAMTKLGGVYDKYLAGPEYQFNRPEAYKASDFTGPNTAREITTGLGPVGSVQDYMNPYIQGVVNVQGQEALRNMEIARQSEAARFAKSASFGGGRQAIAEAEQQRNLATLMNKIAQEGYGTAYDKAQAQRLAEAQQYRAAQEATAVGERAQTDAALRAYQAQETARQQQARLGLDTENTAMAAERLGLDYLAGSRGTATDIINSQKSIQDQQLALLNAQSNAGGLQRGITQAGLTADFNDYLRGYEDPFKRLAAASGAIAPLVGNTSTTNYWGTIPGNLPPGQVSPLGAATSLGIAGAGAATNQNTATQNPFTFGG